MECRIFGGALASDSLLRTETEQLDGSVADARINRCGTEGLPHSDDDGLLISRVSAELVEVDTVQLHNSHHKRMSPRGRQGRGSHERPRRCFGVARGCGRGRRR